MVAVLFHIHGLTRHDCVSCIHDHDIVPTVPVRLVDGLVFAREQRHNARGKAAHDLAVRVDEDPGALRLCKALVNAWLATAEPELVGNMTRALDRASLMRRNRVGVFRAQHALEGTAHAWGPQRCHAPQQQHARSVGAGVA